MTLQPRPHFALHENQTARPLLRGTGECLVGLRRGVLFAAGLIAPGLMVAIAAKPELPELAGVELCLERPWPTLGNTGSAPRRTRATFVACRPAGGTAADEPSSPLRASWRTPRAADGTRQR